MFLGCMEERIECVFCRLRTALSLNFRLRDLTQDVKEEWVLLFVI